jgi:hypothetical protein
MKEITKWHISIEPEMPNIISKFLLDSHFLLFYFSTQAKSGHDCRLSNL